MDAMSSSAEHRIESAQLRRSPRYGVFLLAGAALGILVALILTFAFDGVEDKSRYTGVVYSTSQVFGFVALVCVPVGVALGGVIALILDRVVGRRTRDVRIDRETVVETDEA